MGWSYLVLATVVVALSLGAATTGAQTEGEPSGSISFNALLSKSAAGSFPNGPSRNGVVSSDERISR